MNQNPRILMEFITFSIPLQVSCTLTSNTPQGCREKTGFWVDAYEYIEIMYSINDLSRLLVLILIIMFYITKKKKNY